MGISRMLQSLMVARCEGKSGMPAVGILMEIDLFVPHRHDSQCQSPSLNTPDGVSTALLPRTPSSHLLLQRIPLLSFTYGAIVVVVLGNKVEEQSKKLKGRRNLGVRKVRAWPLLDS